MKMNTHKNLWGSPKEVLRENYVAQNNNIVV